MALFENAAHAMREANYTLYLLKAWSFVTRGKGVVSNKLIFRRYFKSSPVYEGTFHIKITLEQLARDFVKSTNDGYLTAKEGYLCAFRANQDRRLGLELDHEACDRRIALLRDQAMKKYKDLLEAAAVANHFNPDRCLDSYISSNVLDESLFTSANLRRELVAAIGAICAVSDSKEDDLCACA